MIEKKWSYLAPQLFTSNGTSDGKITVGDATLFRVRQQVVIQATGIPSRDDLEVKRITDKNTLFLGPIGGLDLRINLSAYIGQ